MSLIGRVTTINNLALGSIFYAIALWVGLDVELKGYEKEITRFLWLGQGCRKWHRVVEFILFLLRQKGGLKVLSIQQLQCALVGKFILWALRPGTHPLQIILRASIQRLSIKRWGLVDYSWDLIPCNTLLTKCSNIWLNICSSWNCIKKNINPAAPNLPKLQCILVWTPHVGHRILTRLSYRTPVQQHLLHEGISAFCHILVVDGHILDWEHRAVQDLAPAWQRSYSKLVSNLVPIQLPTVPSPKTQMVFVASVSMHEGRGLAICYDQVLVTATMRPGRTDPQRQNCILIL